MIDTKELARQVATGEEPIRQASGIIGAMIAVIVNHRGPDAAQQLLLAFAGAMAPQTGSSPTDL